MKALGLLAFRLGHVASERLSDEFVSFYKWIANALYGEECEVAARRDALSIPISYSMIHRRPFDISHTFSDRIRGWEQPPHVVVVDLANPPNTIVRGGLLANLATTIVGYQTANQRTVFVLLLPELLPEGDILLEILSKPLKDGSVLVVDDAGNVTGKYPGKEFHVGQYAEWLSRIRIDPLKAFSIKLIRRLGHFKRYRNGKHYECLRYFFDGSLCEVELVCLIQNHIAHLCMDKHEPFILYYAPVSPWLERPILALKNDFNIMDVERYIQEQSEGLADSVFPILVVPMLHSGNTVRRLLKELSETKYPLEPRVLSVMSTKAMDEERRLRVLRMGSRHVEVEYLWHVDQVHYPAGDCPLCEHNVPPSRSFEKDDCVMLAPWDKWDMVYEPGVGFKKEDDVPSYRKPLPTVPRYPELIDKNGAWLASKVRALFEFVPNGFPPDPVIVCPREQGSIAFTQCLSLAFEATVIRVPKPVIDLAGELDKGGFENKLRESFGENRPGWYIALNTLLTDHVIVMDEFSVSGRTWKGLVRLLGFFGHSVLCGICVANFEPGTNAKGIQIYSLYELASYPAEQTHG